MTPELRKYFEELFHDELEEGRNEGRNEGVKQGRDEGIKQGRDEGIKQGRDDGIKQGRISLLLKLVKDKQLTAEYACQELDISLEQLSLLLQDE